MLYLCDISVSSVDVPEAFLTVAEALYIKLYDSIRGRTSDIDTGEETLQRFKVGISTYTSKLAWVIHSGTGNIDFATGQCLLCYCTKFTLP